MDNMDKVYITIDEAAALVRCARQTIINRTKSGDLTITPAINDRGLAYKAIDKAELIDTFCNRKTGSKCGYKVKVNVQK
jgi:hypothetical protein